MKKTFKFCPLCGTSLRRGSIEGSKRQFCPKCGWIHYENPLPVAVAAAINSRGQVLVVKRNLNPGINQWSLPGGFVEVKETSQEACLRELKEETGINGRINKLVGVYIHKTRMYGSLLVIGYSVKVLSKNIVISSEIKEAKFASRSKLPHIPFPSHQKILKEVYKQCR
ncbi:MAG: NUDIX domain-containing protein [Candidatus Omnitrophica bacterium]|nr:NUDIX domain-containing protein [Candidatus Omnitrophota bacterium]MDD5429872.1 NUDIX domain-containing protein [Candidatus Omnitrophota bacterium]